MAGILKPSEAGNEGSWVVHAAVDSHSTSALNELFDGIRGGWNSTSTFYWNGASTFIDITLNQKTNIWVIGNPAYLSYNKGLKVERWDGSAWVYMQDTPNRTTSNVWEKMITLDSGRYKFTYSAGLRMDDEWFIEDGSLKKVILSASDGNHYTYDTDWANLGAVLPTEQDFIDYGMDARNLPAENMQILPQPLDVLYYTDQPATTDASVVITANYSPIDELEGAISLVQWTDDPDPTQKTLRLSDTLPLDQLVVPNADISLASVENIDSFTLATTLSGTAVVKVAVSFDEGVTWHTRTSGAWSTIELDEAALKDGGITPAALAALTTLEWAEVRNGSNTVRFAYLLAIESTTDTLEVHELTSQIDMRGAWESAANGTEYRYRYSKNDELVVKMLADGDWKINYYAEKDASSEPDVYTVDGGELT